MSGRARGAGHHLRREETRARLLAAARAAFIDGSVVSTPLDAVAAAASTSKATLFFHFRDRRGLLAELARQVYLELVAEVQAARPGDVRSFLRAYLGVQPDPRARLLWEVGDVLTADGAALLPDLPYEHLRLVLEHLLRDEAIPEGRQRHLVAVVAPAAFLLARRVSQGLATDDEVAAFVAHVDAVAHATGTPATSPAGGPAR